VNIDRLEDIKNYPTFNDSFGKGEHISSFSSLCFEDVCCHYLDKPDPVITDCSFELAQGERMLILGGTGSGKSTIANLVLGLLLPTKGEIKVNGVNIANLDIKSLRDVVAYVPQEPLLFGGTVKDNILFAVGEASEIEYNIAVKTSQLESEIANFPDKHQTLVGNRGLGVSGGQKQRLTIARALIKRPELLILDDITASLDAENEEKLWLSIDANYPGISAIVISHRLSTLRYVNSVLFLDSHGKSHKGTHEELVFGNPEYHDFLHEHLKQS